MWRYPSLCLVSPPCAYMLDSLDRSANPWPRGVLRPTSCRRSIQCQTWRLTWMCWAPPRVCFFHWLANLVCCWTADRPARRSLPHPQRCPLCDQAPETIQHLLLGCPFSRPMWYAILSWLRLSYLPPDNDATLHDWWLSINTLVARIQDETALWARALGLRAILPQTWDVH